MLDGIGTRTRSTRRGSVRGRVGTGCSNGAGAARPLKWHGRCLGDAPYPVRRSRRSPTRFVRPLLRPSIASVGAAAARLHLLTLARSPSRQRRPRRRRRRRRALVRRSADASAGRRHEALPLARVRCSGAGATDGWSVQRGRSGAACGRARCTDPSMPRTRRSLKSTFASSDSTRSDSACSSRLARDTSVTSRCTIS